MIVFNSSLDNITVTWKLLGEITSSIYLTLPSSYNELLIMAVNNDDVGNNVYGSYVIPKYIMDNVVANNFIIPIHANYYVLLACNKAQNKISYGGTSTNSDFKKMVVFYR